MNIDEYIKMIQNCEDKTKKRQLIIKLGGFDPKISFPYFVRFLREDEDYGIRLNAASSLGDSGLFDAIEPLIYSLINDPDPQVREISASALGNLGFPQALPTLIKSLFEDDDEDTREMCVVAIGKLYKYHPDAVEGALLISKNSEIDPGVRYFVDNLLGKIMMNRRNN